MHAGNLQNREIGALVLQTGRQAGARRPLGGPTTFLGRSQSCDIRLNVDGVDPLHCLIVCGAEGVLIRDLESVQGTYVNGTRTDQCPLQNGDVLKVGPFQFRIELDAMPAKVEEPPIDDVRDALRIQAAAVAAQQAALEEEEIRLQERRSNLQEQEEQLAAHLDEKQRQVQVWADFTKAEREALRKEKADQEKHLARLEKELWDAKEAVAAEQEKATQARARMDKIYQRLRQRWQRQWAGEREKHQRLADELTADRAALREREHALHQRESAFADELVQHHSENELAQRRLREGRDALRADQDSWRRRRAQEHLVLKAGARDLAETQIKVKQIRQLLVAEKDSWERQQDSLQKELHGLNNRIVHQRARIQEQHEEIARLDSALRERRLHIHAEAHADDGIPEAVEVEIIGESSSETARRCEDLNRLAGELADQRAQLLEQYKRLAGIQDAWQAQRDTAVGELEMLARRLIDEEHALAERERHTTSAEELTHERTRECDVIRHELQTWRAQLKHREQTFAQQHQKDAQALRQHQKLLEEQLAGLAVLRQRWNLRRQQEIERLHSDRALLSQELKQTQDRRLVLFEKTQHVDEEKRLLAEKALALEEYRQEVLGRAKDPAAQRRIDRLRRRWLTTNSALIRNAKAAGESIRKELAELEALRAELMQATTRLTHDQSELADKQAAVEEREATLRIRQQQVELELSRLQSEQNHADVEAVAQAVYQEPDDAVDRAA